MHILKFLSLLLGTVHIEVVEPCLPESLQTFTVSDQYSHYSLLATVEAIFNLGTLGRNDTSATAMADLFRGGIP
jgi:hypothetical protein